MFCLLAIFTCLVGCSTGSKASFPETFIGSVGQEKADALKTLGVTEQALSGYTVDVYGKTADVQLSFDAYRGDETSAGKLNYAELTVPCTPNGDGFSYMHTCYDKELIAKATAIAEEENIKLQYGVYVGGTGPTFETQAEYRYFKAIGGDAAGMSTVPEVIVARHMSIPVFGVSVITNCGLSDEVGDHEDVQRQGKKAGVRMELLFRRMIKNL